MAASSGTSGDGSSVEGSGTSTVSSAANDNDGEGQEEDDDDEGFPEISLDELLDDLHVSTTNGSQMKQVERRMVSY